MKNPNITFFVVSSRSCFNIDFQHRRSHRDRQQSKEFIDHHDGIHSSTRSSLSRLPKQFVLRFAEALSLLLSWHTQNNLFHVRAAWVTFEGGRDPPSLTFASEPLSDTHAHTMRFVARASSRTHSNVVILSYPPAAAWIWIELTTRERCCVQAAGEVPTASCFFVKRPPRLSAQFPESHELKIRSNDVAL